MKDDFLDIAGVTNKKKLPYGISNYEELIEGGYYYVDKTRYIEKLENLPEKSIRFLRPRKFGKTLFTSTLENYYDINKKEKFEKLYGDTYIGQNPTELRNSYYILKFNFSGIDTTDVENIILGFKNKIIISIRSFIEKYNLDIFINENQEAEMILYNLFQSFETKKHGEKIYVIIDEYDYFVKEQLEYNIEKDKNLELKSRKIRCWYEILKEGTESVVDRIFITGIIPLTLDSLTSGFNICSDKTRNANFNEMLGFTKEELIEMINNQEILEKKELLLMIREDYGGYKFSLQGKEKMYNSNICLYLLNEYLETGRMPDSLIDANRTSAYTKIAKILSLCKREIIEKAITEEVTVSEIITEFNFEKEFTEKDMISILFYFGYLTIKREELKVEVIVKNNNTM